MKRIRNRSLPILPILLSLLLLLLMIHSMSVLASQQKSKGIKITNTKISQIVDKKYSGTVTRAFQINPDKTVLTNAVISGNSAVLTWKKNKGSDRYQIYYAKDKDGKFVRLSTVDKTKTSYTVKNVKEGTWYYKVRAYKTVNNKKYYGVFSNMKEITYKSTASSQPDPTVPVQPEEKVVSIDMKAGNTTFTVTLAENDTVKAFVSRLPLTVNMSELNGNEKYNFLSDNLRADASSNPGTIKEGDVMLYGDNCLVLFYKSFHTSFNYVKIGHIDNTTDLGKVVGSGNVQVTFSVSD